MTKLPRISAKEVIRALERCGFFVKRQSGSHIIMRHQTDLSRRCIIPVHGSKTIKLGALHSILKGVGLTTEEFLKLLK